MLMDPPANPGVSELKGIPFSHGHLLKKNERYLWIAILSMVFLIFHPYFVNAAPVTFYGYVRSEFTEGSADDSGLMLLHKLRLDVESDLSEHLFLGGNINFLHYRGDHEGNLLDNVPGSISDQVAPVWRQFFDYSYEDDIVWDNLFLKYRFPDFDLTIGKQQISFGSGYVWNPTDLFNIKSIVDPTDEKSGHKALRIDYPLTISSGIMFLLDLEDLNNEPGALFQYKTTYGHFDYFLTFASIYRSFSDYDDFSQVRERCNMAGFDMAGEVLGIGFWFEVAHCWPESQADFYEFVLGGDYTWENGFYFLAEYLYSSYGCTGTEDCDITSWMRFFSGETKAISRQNLYLYGSYPATDLVTLGFSVVSSLSDGSSVIIPTMEYSLFEDINLEIFSGFNLGKDGTVYSSELGNGYFARLTWYF